MRKLAVSLVPIAGALAVAYGCVGDDPVASNPSDGGTASSSSGGSSSGGSSSGGSSSGGSSSGDGGGEAGPPTCAGQTFGTPVPIDVSAITGLGVPTPYLWGPRVVGNKAYFAANVTSGEQRLFTAPFNLGEGKLGPRTELAEASAGPGAEWAPAASADESFVVFAYNTTVLGGRDLYSAQLPAGAPTIEAILNKGASDVDDTDPYLVGSPTKAVYYASGPNGTSQSLFRAARMSGAFLAPIGLLQPGQCARAYCGTPVVTPDEKTILFATWDAGGFVPSVREAALQLTTLTAPYMSSFVEHPELGNRYPSWVSDDGCAVIVAHGEPSQLFVARRSAK
ncbi:MAG: hypothetical protein JNL38_31385 [Myxococcales bacterium]|nr:hypothetical protein [Myxococcales bacterium]